VENEARGGLLEGSSTAAIDVHRVEHLLDLLAELGVVLAVVFELLLECHLQAQRREQSAKARS
jgi:hypothetical protein